MENTKQEIQTEDLVNEIMKSLKDLEIETGVLVTYYKVRGVIHKCLDKYRFYEKK